MLGVLNDTHLNVIDIVIPTAFRCLPTVFSRRIESKYRLSRVIYFLGKLKHYVISFLNNVLLK